MVKSKPTLSFNIKYPHIGCYELSIFFFLLFNFIAMTSENSTDSILKTHYLLTYEFGFGSRMLIGSIISLFTHHVTNHVIYIVGTISYVLLISFISLLLGGAIRKSPSSMKSTLIVFSVLFLASPLSVTYLLGGNFGRLDTYWFFITLLGLVFLKRPILQWMVPLLCAAAILVHQGYLFTYMPALAIPLLYEVYKHKFSKKSIAVFSLSCLAMILLFIFFQFFPSNIPFDNAIDFAAYLSKNSGFSPSALMLYFEYYAKFPTWFFDFTLPQTLHYALPYGLTLLAFSAPLTIIFGYIWRQSIKHEENKFLKFIFILCVMAPLAFIPAAVFGNDWDRWWAAVVNNQFILIFYFIYSNESAVNDSVKKVGVFFEKHFLLLLMIIIFTNSLTFSAAVTEILTFVRDPSAVFKITQNYINEFVNGALIIR